MGGSNREPDRQDANFGRERWIDDAGDRDCFDGKLSHPAYPADDFGESRGPQRLPLLRRSGSEAEGVAGEVVEQRRVGRRVPGTASAAEGGRGRQHPPGRKRISHYRRDNGGARQISVWVRPRYARADEPARTGQDWINPVWEPRGTEVPIPS